MVMQNVLFFGRMDAAELAFWVFFIFFLGLVIWLVREGRREGFPLESDVSGRLRPNQGLLQVPPAKTFNLPFDQGSVTVPYAEPRQPIDVPGARRVFPGSGSPIEPTGSGIGAGIGPGAYAERSNFPDVSHDGKPRIVPIGDSEMTVVTQDRDPRGMTVLGADGAVAGTVTDIWVDRSESMIRYLTVALEPNIQAKGSAIVPVTMVIIDQGKGRVRCSALNAAQFAGAPGVAKKGIITRLEEEKIVGYFGSGYLYASADRQEPFI
jgi:photosynthetic reaction center H subunit